MAAVVLILAACSGGSSAHTLTGTVRLTDYDGIFRDGKRCTGTEGYDDISAGADVRIEDGDGNLVGTSELIGDGYLRNDDCVFSFVATDVQDADFYTVTVAQRGGPAYKKSDLETEDWHVGLTLG